MAKALLGKKVGMTRLYDSEGINVPVTVIEVGPCFITQIKTEATDGYNAIQIGFEDVKARNSTNQLIGHDAKAGVSPKRHHSEVSVTADELAEYELGQELTVDSLSDIVFVDVIGTSKGKGTAGVMKRWGFKGQEASHGVERKHRAGGSIGGRSSNLGTGSIKKGIRMSGRHGNARITVRNLDIVERNSEKNLLIVKGPVPGPNGGLVVVRQSKRLWKQKAAKAKAAQAS
jgi:large subunit ribosomal protein L3